MTVTEIQAVLAQNPGVALHLMLPDGDFVPAHFHITEVGKLRKDFIDCGGTIRSTASCLLQVWVATDTDHRLESTKLAKIITMAGPLLGTDDLPVEVEYEAGVVSQYPLGGVEVTPAGLLFSLGTKHTACLAQDRCGVPGVAGAAAQGCC
ncbi:MAG: DUF6428 family protein [Fimbriiglobus sp.]